MDNSWHVTNKLLSQYVIEKDFPQFKVAMLSPNLSGGVLSLEDLRRGGTACDSGGSSLEGTPACSN